MNNHGFTLIEVMIAGAIFSIVGLLSFIALQSSNDSVALTGTKSLVQSNLRDVMTSLSAELRPAFTARLAGTPAADQRAQPIAVSPDGRSVEFQVPTPESLWGAHPVPAASSRIRIFFENEDINGNGILDTGEDQNNDGALTRRLMREQDGVAVPLGGANDLSEIQFQLLPHTSVANLLSRLSVRIVAAQHYGASRDHEVRAEIESIITLEN